MEMTILDALQAFVKADLPNKAKKMVVFGNLGFDTAKTVTSIATTLKNTRKAQDLGRCKLYRYDWTVILDGKARSTAYLRLYTKECVVVGVEQYGNVKNVFTSNGDVRVVMKDVPVMIGDTLDDSFGDRQPEMCALDD